MTPHITTFNCNPNYITVDDHQEHNFFFITFDTNQIYRPLELYIKYQEFEYFSLLTRTSDVSAVTFLQQARIHIGFRRLRKCDEYF